MNLWVAAVWGVVGGMCVEGLEQYATIRRTPGWHWRMPIPQGLTAYVTSVAIRVCVGAAVAGAMAGSHQVSGPLAAFGLGISAPLVVEKLARFVPLTDAPASGNSSQPPIESCSASHRPSEAVGGETQEPMVGLADPPSHAAESHPGVE